MTGLYEVLEKEARAIASARGWLNEPVRIKAKVLSTEEAIGNPEASDFPLQKGKERLIQAELRDSMGQAFTDRFGDFDGRLSEVLSGRLENNFRRAVFVATVNAMLREAGLDDRTIHCRDKEPVRCAAELVNYLTERHQGAKIAQVGFQPRMVEALAPSFHLRVLDLDPDNVGVNKFGITIESADVTQKAVQWADVLLVTGSTLVNGTIESFLVGKPVIFYGTTIAGAASLMGWKRFCPCAR